MARNKTTFGKDNQPTRRRGKSERGKILDAMKRQSRTEEEFYDLLVQRAFNPEDNFAFKELLARHHPVPKSTLPLVVFEFPVDGTALQKIEALEAAISSGEIAADVAKLMVDIIKSGMEVAQITELQERIEALEQALIKASNGSSGTA